MTGLAKILAEWQENQQDSRGYDAALELAVAALAGAYSGHPDFDPAWTLQ